MVLTRSTYFDVTIGAGSCYFLWLAVNHIYTQIHELFCLSSASEDEDRVQKALQYVSEIGGENCETGTKETLPLQFDVTVWNEYAYTAIRLVRPIPRINMDFVNKNQ